MKLSEAPKGTILEMDKLKFLCLGNGTFYMALPGQKMSKGDIKSEPRADMDLPESNKKEFIKAMKKAKHKNDWFSLFCKEAAERELEEISC